MSQRGSVTRDLTIRLISLLQNNFVCQVLTVASGTAAAQVIVIVFSPVITRIYGPEAFGQLGSFLAILSVATPAAALAYPVAIVLPRSDDEALALVKLSVVLSFLVSLLTAGALWAGGESLIYYLNLQVIGPYIFLIPAAMVLAACAESIQQWLIRTSDFGTIARVAIARSLIVNVANVGVGWFKPIGPVLLLIATIGNGVNALLLLLGARRKRGNTGLSTKTESDYTLVELLKKYRDFPLYRAPQNIINAASQGLPVLMLAALFGSKAAGFYALARMAMAMPSSLLGKSVSDVFYPRITRVSHSGGAITREITKATIWLALVSLLPFLIVAIFGPALFSFVFGVEWAIAGEYARWLALFFYFNFINKACVAAVPVLGIQRGLLVYELFSTGFKTLGLFLGFYLLHSDVWAVALFSISGAVTYIFMMAWIINHAQRRAGNEETSR